MKSLRNTHRYIFVIVWVLLLWVTNPHDAHAHKLAPSSLLLEELHEGYYRVSWQRPQWVPRGLDQPKVILPDDCKTLIAPQSHAGPTATGVAVFTVSEIDCGAANIFGSTIAVRPLGRGSMVIARITFVNGRSLSTLLTAAQTELHVKDYPGFWSLTGSYLALGTRHILSGFDHMLFVLGLLLLLKGIRPLILLITSFTIGHSISLSLAALNATLIPQALTEFFIAFSILWLAVELSRGGSTQGLLGKYPMWMAVSFGLLHGLGFANALLEIGLPVRDSLASLISFNIGVELGQLCLIAAILILAMWLPQRAMSGLRLIGVYTIGTTAIYWCLDRSVGTLFF